jgi:4a-hydroxytetrahydrobiopterin dehydratase
MVSYYAFSVISGASSPFRACPAMDLTAWKKCDAVTGDPKRSNRERAGHAGDGPRARRTIVPILEEPGMNRGQEVIMEDGCSILAKKDCVPCKGGIPPLKGAELRALESQLGNGWSVLEEHHLEKTYDLPDFKSALALTNRIGEIAESEGHHPDILLAWGKVRVRIWTHKIDGLTESDFILAAKIEGVA